MKARPAALMGVDERAFRIIDHEINIQIIGVRTPESYGSLAIPGSSNIQMRELFSKDWITTFSKRHVKKVIVGGDEAQEQSACLLLQELGYENLAILQGGFEAFNKTILSPRVTHNNS